jgi:transposase, IS5 family
MNGHIIRTIGLERAKVKIGLLNLTYNMKRLVQLTAIDTRRLAGLAAGLDGVTAPVVA